MKTSILMLALCALIGTGFSHVARAAADPAVCADLDKQLDAAEQKADDACSAGEDTAACKQAMADGEALVQKYTAAGCDEDGGDQN